MSRARHFIDVFRGYRVPHLAIISNRSRWFITSGVLVAICLLSLFTKELTLSLEFEGGALLKYPNQSGVSVGDVQGTLAKYGRGDAEVQIIDGTEVSIRTSSLTDLGDRRTPLLSELAQQAGIQTDEINTTDVGPTWGKQISSKALQGLVIFLVLVSLYIAFRFEWKMAIAAMVALFHDIIITIGVYSLTGREVTPATVIALLTILGYSLYDTVVIFDKVQENTASTSLVARESYAGVVNMSLNQTLMRSVNTSLVVLLPILSLLLFGGDTLKNFAFALFVGVASGTFSSVFVAAPVLVTLKEREPKYRALRERRKAKAAAEKAEKAPASGELDEDVARELEAAGVIKRQAAAASSAPKPKEKQQGGKGSGGSKNKKKSAKQRRRR